MSADALLVDLTAHVPKWVGSYLRRAESGESTPVAEQRRVALLQLDIANFSVATDRLSGRRAEELNALIGDCFGLLSEVVEAHGGDIVAFAGDAILAIWDIDDGNEAAARAAQCGLALRDVMRSWGGEHGDIGHRTAIEVGDVHFCRMGGFEGRWHYFVVGDPIVRMGAAYRAAAVGDVALCQAASTVLASIAKGEPTPFGMQLLELRSPYPPRRSSSVDILPKALESVLSKVVRDGVELGHGTWMGEYRSLTIVRIVTHAIAFAGNLQPQLNALVHETQAVVHTLEGVIHQVLMDDKGLNLNVVFGLPHLAHEDDPLRAVEAAMAICRRMRAIGVEVSVGVATGGLFCGTYGGRVRREYGIFGHAINLAALLADVGRPEVVCDAVTAQAVASQVAFTILPHIYPKGGVAPVMAFSPQGRAERPHERQAAVGRDNERARLKDCLDDIARGQGKLILVSGEPGIGKSRILTDMVASAEARGLVVLQGFATAINRTTAYFVWRAVLRQLLGEGPETASAVLRAKLEETFAGNPTYSSWLPLLETVIPAGLVENPLTEQITGAARAAAIEDLVVAMLTRAARPRILVLEDLHWFDSSSVDLLAAVARRAPRVLIVVSDRTGPVVGSIADRQTRLAPSAEIRLQALSRDAIEQIMRRRLQVAAIPAQLGAFVHHHAGGNPFYSDELVLALRDTGRIRVMRGVCEIDDLGRAASSIALTDSLERAIVSRIDVLSREDQIVLKVASAIGDEFTLELLENVFPDRVAGTSIASAVKRLVDNEFLVPRQTSSGSRFDFRHSLTREAAYGLLSLAQRRLLHHAIAVFIEASNASQLQPFHARLARHWEQASDLTRALHYLELAADQALLNYSNREAIRYVEEMLDMAKSADIAVADERRAAWEIIRGDAHHELSEYETSSQRYAAAMGLLGERVPATSPAKARALAYNCAAQLLHRIRAPNGDSLTASRRLAMQRASHIYEHLSEQYFFLNDSLAVLNGTLASLNLAELCGATPETIRGLGALSLGLGMSGLVGPARNYSRRAYRLAERRGTLPDMARVHLVGGVLEYGLGAWEVVRRRSEESVALYRQLGDRTRVQVSQVMDAFAALLSGDIERVERIDAALLSELSQESSAQVRAWRLSIRLLLDALTGDADAADIAKLRALADARLIRTDRLLCLGVVAACCHRRGETERAAEIALQGLQVLSECSAVWGGYAYGPAGVVNVLVSRWERSTSDDRADRSVRVEAEAAVGHLSRLARASPICQPQALIASGRARLLAHRTGAARRRFQRAITVATRLRMPYDQATAHDRLAATFVPGQPARSLHLREAREIYDRLGATVDLARVDLALRETGAAVG